MPPVGPAQFREFCGRFATGVVVVTASDGGGVPYGMTANSFASVSLAPPLISINVDHAADFHQIITIAQTFVINILSANQEIVSRRFATKNPDRFEGIGYRRTESGGVILDGVIAALECQVEQRIVAGDHTIVIAQVISGEVQDGRPLLYYRGGYHGMT